MPFKAAKDVPYVEAGSPLEKYGWVLKNLLQTLEAQGKEVTPFLDAILVDEGQDLVFDERYKYKGKQPFYWLAYQTLRPAQPTQESLLELGQSPAGEEPLRRLLWAYDEAQSLDSLLIPTARELFGEGLSDLVSGQYPGGIRKSEIMHRCYRTPGPILVAAHALGMGPLRQGGMLTGITTRGGG
jgi:superfamily I DNA and RNA helicase